MSYRADKQASDWYTHKQGHTDRHTDAGDENTQRPKLASGKNEMNVKTHIYTFTLQIALSYIYKTRFLISVRVNTYICYEIWDEITFPLQNFNGLPLKFTDPRISFKMVEENLKTGFQ